MSERLTTSLLAILRAAHCRSTHHHFAIDALPLVSSPAGKRLASQLLRHHTRYLTGAKDPDMRFRDFQNHVIHVDDGYWGGAPRVAHQWYDRLQRYLSQSRFSDAAHAAGVLSHYFTDPIQPLHTAQTPVEKVLHRPIEWSVTKSYHSLFEQWKNEHTRIVFQLSDQPGWLGDAILQAARIAHGHYETLLNHYDLVAGKSNPPAGLDSVSRSCMSDLIGLAVTGWARVIERAAFDAEQRLGHPLATGKLTLATALAGIRVPDRLWLRRIEHREEQEKVRTLVEQFRRDGELTTALPSEVRIIEKVRAIHARERDFSLQRQQRLQSAAEISVVRQDEVQQEEVVQVEQPPLESDDSNEQPSVLPFVAAQVDGARLYVTDPLVDAPSIGKKTSARFADIGIHTVGEFLAADMAVAARKLATKWITHDTLIAWQCQTILMCQLPDMLAREVQLLVGAGFRTSDAIAKTTVGKLQASLNDYAATYSGRRHLRGAEPPDSERLETIIGDAALAMVKQKRGLHRQSESQPTSAIVKAA